MSTSRTTGLGDPEPFGKGALFRPPERLEQKPKKAKPRRKSEVKKKGPQRVRTTLYLSRRALAIVQQMQNKHRLETGKALEMWRAVSEAIEYYGDEKGIETN